MKIIDRCILAGLAFALMAFTSAQFVRGSEAEARTKSLSRVEVEQAVRTVLREQRNLGQTDISGAVQTALRGCTLILSEVAERESGDPVRYIGNWSC